MRKDGGGLSERAARCPVCLPGIPFSDFTAPTDEALFAKIAGHVMKVHGAGQVEAFESAEDALPGVGIQYRRQAGQLPPQPDAGEAARLAEVRSAIAGTGAISGTGSTGEDARYLVDGQWLDYAAAKAAGRLPEGEDDPGEARLARPGNPVPADVLAETLRRVADVQAGQGEASEDEDDGCE